MLLADLGQCVDFRLVEAGPVVDDHFAGGFEDHIVPHAPAMLAPLSLAECVAVINLDAVKAFVGRDATSSPSVPDPPR
jgi:hypothetical protein